MKKYTNNMRKYALLVMLLPLTMAALTFSGTMGEASPEAEDEDSISAAVDGSLLDFIDSLQRENHELRVMGQIIFTMRSYGDSIALRWCGEDYMVQQALNIWGVDIIRMDMDAEGLKFDTLAYHFKPWSKNQFLEYYPQEDSLAMMAYGLMYGDKQMKPDQTQNAPGTIGSIVELSENQKQHHMFCVLLSEWRHDLANHMAMRWVDRNVIPGHHYTYSIIPSEFDREGPLQVASATKTIVNERFVKPDFDVQMGDSIVAPFQFRLWWKANGISSFEIEQRRMGQQEWTRLTDVPFLNMQTDNGQKQLGDCNFIDIVDSVGYYEYRVIGHDAFGDLTNPSPAYRAYMPDLIGPRAPELKLVEIDRQDSTDLSKQVWATFHFEKDTMEEDFIGFVPMYYNERHTGHEWKKLSERMLDPTDTTFTCDMTGYSTGMVIVAAYDTAQNVSYSLPRMVQIQDVKAPAMMRNFKAEPNLEDGTVTLTWEPDPADDDIEYYELTYANDTTHSFMLRSTQHLHECTFVDTVAMDINQKYIYYKVRAVDYSHNQGEETPPLQVLRPTRLKPSKAHLLESSVDSLGIHMTWACSNEQIMDRHVLLRRLEGSETWDTLGVYSADSIKLEHNRLTVTDVPGINRQLKYEYALESFTCFDVSSGLSYIVQLAFRGSHFIQADLQLRGHYDNEQKMTLLNWTCDYPVSDDWYYCLYRKGPKDKHLKFLMSLSSDTKEYTVSRLHAGETEEYYIIVKLDDGRESHASETIVITAPAE